MNKTVHDLSSHPEKRAAPASTSDSPWLSPRSGSIFFHGKSLWEGGCRWNKNESCPPVHLGMRAIIILRWLLGHHRHSRRLSDILLHPDLDANRFSWKKTIFPILVVILMESKHADHSRLPISFSGLGRADTGVYHSEVAGNSGRVSHAVDCLSHRKDPEKRKNVHGTLLHIQRFPIHVLKTFFPFTQNPPIMNKDGSPKQRKAIAAFNWTRSCNDIISRCRNTPYTQAALDFDHRRFGSFSKSGLQPSPSNVCSKICRQCPPLYIL